MNAIPEQFLARQKAGIDTIIAANGVLFSGFEKLVDLNLKVIRASMDEAAQSSPQTLGMKDSQDLAAFASSVTAPSAEKALAYSKHVYDIMADVQCQLATLGEEQITQGQRQVANAIEQLSKNAPAGSESAVAIVKSSFAAANSAYESLTSAAKQAAGVAESNLNAAANASFKAATDAADAGTKAASRRSRAAA